MSAQAQPSSAAPPYGSVTRFSDEHWFALLDGQEGQSVVDDIMQHVIDNAQQSLLERHVERRLISYTVAAGRGALDFLINWHYFEPDHGHLDSVKYTVDEEPPQIPQDSWARNAMKVLTTLNHGQGFQAYDANQENIAVKQDDTARFKSQKQSSPSRNHASRASKTILSTTSENSLSKSSPRSSAVPRLPTIPSPSRLAKNSDYATSNTAPAAGAVSRMSPVLVKRSPVKKLVGNSPVSRTGAPSRDASLSPTRRLPALQGVSAGGTSRTSSK